MHYQLHYKVFGPTEPIEKKARARFCNFPTGAFAFRLKYLVCCLRHASPRVEDLGTGRLAECRIYLLHQSCATCATHGAPTELMALVRVVTGGNFPHRTIQSCKQENRPGTRDYFFVTAPKVVELYAVGPLSARGLTPLA